MEDGLFCSTENEHKHIAAVDSPSQSMACEQESDDNTMKSISVTAARQTTRLLSGISYSSPY